LLTEDIEMALAKNIALMIDQMPTLTQYERQRLKDAFEAASGSDPQTTVNTDAISDNADAIALLAGAKIRIVTGTTDTILAADSGGIVVYTNAAAIAVVLPDGLPVLHDFTAYQVTELGIPSVTPSGSDTTNGAQDAIAPSAQSKGAYFAKYDTGLWLSMA
jgi:hypothetical protein